MKVVWRLHVWVPKGNRESRHIAPQKHRVSRQHALFTEQGVQRELAEDGLVLMIVNMFQTFVGAFGKRHADVVRMIEAVYVGRQEWWDKLISVSDE